MHILPLVTFEEEIELVVVFSIQELLGRIVHVLEGSSALGETIGKIDADHLFARLLVPDAQYRILVVLGCWMQYETGEHQGGVSGTLLYGTLRSGELGVPGLVWGVCQLLVWEERIVVIDVAIGIGYLITEVVGLDVGWIVQLMQTDGELLGVSDETDGMVGNLKVFHLYRFVAQSLPEGIKRKCLVFYLSGISVESGTEGFDAFSCCWS